MRDLESVSSCRAALRRAGVRDADIDRLHPDAIRARGLILLQQEHLATEAVVHLTHGAARAITIIEKGTGTVDIEQLSGNAAVRALSELWGLRRGIELITGGGYDRAAIPKR